MSQQSRDEYALYLLQEVQWWLFMCRVVPYTQDDSTDTYVHGHVHGVHTIIKHDDLKELADKYGLPEPSFLVGG